MSDSNTAVEEITEGSVVRITGSSASSEWIGLTGTVENIMRVTDGGIDQVYIVLTDGLTRPDNDGTNGFYWPADKVALVGTVAASESNAEAVKEPEPEVTFAEGEIVRVTELYVGEALDTPYLAEYVQPYNNGSDYGRRYYSHVVRAVASGNRHPVGTIEKVSSLAVAMREMISAQSEAETMAREISEKKDAEFSAWKLDASIKAMRVAIENNMCSQTEKAMHSAEMPTMVTAEVTLSLRLDIPVREYVKADMKVDDDGDPCSDRDVIARAAYMLATVTSTPAYKWEERISSVSGVALAKEQNVSNCKCGYCD